MVEVHKVSGAAFDGNVYLILDKRPILVDAGMMAAPTLRNIKKFIDPAKIEMIVLTHCHHDHSGAAPELKAPAYEVDETLKEGMVLDTGEWKLEVMETPGHSTGSLCLYEPQAKVLFSGDTVFPDGNIGRTDMYGGSTPDLVASIERLTGIDVEIMYPGHMEITGRDVKKQIEMSLRFAKSML
ncbi:MAG: Metallo-beta-lactamase domain protein [Methanosaeta sp. NSM2]|nr:MBL fold metallo-hydrolase [Methanothrix sp.]OYV12839.1 MAG: Metallo-beta-lactamase domain protein [Methanosaeta sp. NSM2]